MVDPQELSEKRRRAALSGWRDLTPEQRSARTAKARATRLQNLADEIDPYRQLSDEDRLAMAKGLQRVKLAEATLRSSVVRARGPRSRGSAIDPAEADRAQREYAVRADAAAAEATQRGERAIEQAKDRARREYGFDPDAPVRVIKRRRPRRRPE